MTRFFRVGRALGARSLEKTQAGEVPKARSFENSRPGKLEAKRGLGKNQNRTGRIPLPAYIMYGGRALGAR